MSVDLTDLEGTDAVRIVGADLSGTETTPIGSTSVGAMKTSIRTSTDNEIAFGHGSADSSTVRTAAQIGVGGSAVSTSNRVPTTDILTSSYITAGKTSTNTASIARVGTSNLTGRKVIEIINTSSGFIYVGSSTVATSGSNQGRPVRPNGTYMIAVSDAVDIYVISPTNSSYVVVEGA